MNQIEKVLFKLGKELKENHCVTFLFKTIPIQNYASASVFLSPSMFVCVDTKKKWQQSSKRLKTKDNNNKLFSYDFLHFLLL